MSNSSSLKRSRTDWDRLESLRDEDIDLSDIPELTPEMFEHAVVCAGRQAVRPKLEVMLQLDADIIEWFKALSPDYQDRINALLRAYMEAQHRLR